MSTSSAAWDYFTMVETNADKASCKTCGKEYASPGGTTSSLINQLKAKHKELHKNYINVSKAKETRNKKCSPVELLKVEGEPVPKQTKIEDCIANPIDTLNKAITDAIVDFLADAGVAFRVDGLELFY